jgi:DNA-binding NarL/FixJ family response regulator
MNKDDFFKYNIILADNYRPVRRLVKEIIEASPELKVVGEVDDGLELLNLLKKSPAQMVVMGIAMPNTNGFETIKRIKENYPVIKVLVLTIHNYKYYLNRAMSSGAEGYVLKGEMDQELVPAITSIRQRKPYLSSSLFV